MKLSVMIAAILCAALLAQQQEPKAPPPGRQREPGLFGGAGKKKEKGGDENERAVAGYVRTSSEDAVEGAVVQLKDTKSLKVRSFITKEDGAYRFYGLSGNVDYELRANFKDMISELRTLSVFDGRKQAVINLKVQPKPKEAKK